MLRPQSVPDIDIEVDPEFSLSDSVLESLAEFLLSYLTDDEAPDADQQEERQRSIEAAERDLDQAGI